VNSLQSIIVTLSVSYALIGALLLVVIVYARLPWPAKAIAVVVTSAFYVVSFVGARSLLGWASVDKLPASFKLLQARIVDPHTVESDPGSVYLTRTIGRAVCRGPTACHTAMRWPRRPTRQRTRSRPGAPREAAPPISEPVKVG
jgi:hypothetical protein